MSDTSSNSVTNRQELIFLYDAVDANPNGNPLTEHNRPRRDPDTGQALVTATRLKRVVRDYLDDTGETIFIKASGDEMGGRHDKDSRYDILREKHDLSEDDDLTPDEFLNLATDVRLFGDAMAFDGSPIEGSYTGPVQFDIGRSMHRTRELTLGKTSVLNADDTASDSDGTGGNMFNEYRIAYALMRFHGVIDERSAADTNMTEADVYRLMDGLWEGTRSQTNTSSKRGHEPRLLLRVTFADGEGHIGDLHHELDLEPDTENARAMRDITDATIDISGLLTTLRNEQETIATVSGRLSRRIQITRGTERSGPEECIAALEDAVGTDRVDIIVD